MSPPLWSPLLLLVACGPTPGPTADDPKDDADDTHLVGDSDTGPPDTGPFDTGVPAGPPSVILFIGDGMGFAHVAGGGIYANGSAGSLTMETLPYQGRLRTASLSGTTDSAAASTAYASGQKTWNGWLGLDRNGVELATLVDLARERGMATGIVTTDTLTGATPSGFLVHTTDRGDTEGIAAQQVANLPDVFLGGGLFALEALLEGEDVELVTDGPTLDAAAGADDDSAPDERPLVGLFAADTMPYVVNGLGTAPTLAQMTAAAVSRLESAPNGFFLMVEGARIDHASHSLDADAVHAETAAFDEAIAAGMVWAQDHGDVTLLVTADHECGGMIVGETGTAGETPDTSWRWGAHTNADVPIFAMGSRASLFDGQRLDALWVHAVLAAVVEERDVVDPAIVPLIDGWLDDVGAPIAVQIWDTDYGPGFDQLDALRVTADEDGVRVGMDGVYDRSNNTVVVLFDVDFGAGTGLAGSDASLPDTSGALEGVLSNLTLTTSVPGLGFDFALVSQRARELALDELQDDSGLRGLREPWAYEGDLWWLPGGISYDDGNVSVGDTPAADQANTGSTEHGLEAFLPWSSVWPSGVPEEGQTIAVVAMLVYTDGSSASNQALPPLDAEPSGASIHVQSVARVVVGGDGAALDAADIVR